MPYINSRTIRKRVSPRLTGDFVDFLSLLGLNEFGQQYVHNPFYLREGQLKEVYYEDKNFIIRPHDIFFSPYANNIPNFVDKHLGVEIYWYKRPFQSSESNCAITFEYIEELKKRAKAEFE